MVDLLASVDPLLSHQACREGEGEGGRERERTQFTHAYCLRRQALSPSICNVCVRARVHVRMHTHARTHTHACVAFRVGNVERRENCRRIQQRYLVTKVDWKVTRYVPGPVFRGSVLMVVWAAGCRGASCSRNADSGCARNVASAHLLGGVFVSLRNVETVSLKLSLRRAV